MVDSCNQRRRRWVDPPVQLACVTRLMLLVAVTTLLTLFVAAMLRGFNGIDEPGSVEFVDASFWLPALLGLFVTLPIAVWDLVRFTNRFVGPVYRLRNDMRKLAAGEPVGPMQFRQGDYWHELAEAFNEVARRNAAIQASQAETVAGDRGEFPVLEQADPQRVS